MDPGKDTPQQNPAAESGLGDLAAKFPELFRGQEQRPLAILDSRAIYPLDVLRLQATYGFSELDAQTGTLLVRSGPRRFRPDLPRPSRQRIIDRTIRECEQCRQNPEAAYLTNVWNALLSVLALRDPPDGSGHPDRTRAPMPGRSRQPATPADRTQRICREVWPLFCLAQFLELSPIEVLDLSADDCDSILRILQAVQPGPRA